VILLLPAALPVPRLSLTRGGGTNALSGRTAARDFFLSKVAGMGRCSRRALSIFALALSVVLFSPVRSVARTILRVGHFPNITHAHGLIAHALSRQGRGWFEQRLGPDVRIEWFVYNAGPSAIEAILAKSIDLTYVGPNPALNAYAKSRGQEVRLIAGAASGGSALVVQRGSGLKTASDFRGKKIATPQLGNTQDVAARSWLLAGGLRITQMGGDAQVLPTANPDQLLLFRQKQLDGVWTVEPWVSLLETEAGGEVLIEEPDAVTTVLVARADFLKTSRDLVRKFVLAHRELTDWIVKNPAEAQRLVREELTAETRTNASEALISRAWRRIGWVNDVPRAALDRLVASAQAVGFLRGVPDLAGLIEPP
jgi:NitT/TauT family transport system substrate-binding protein